MKRIGDVSRRDTTSGPCVEVLDSNGRALFYAVGPQAEKHYRSWRRRSQAKRRKDGAR